MQLTPPTSTPLTDQAARVLTWLDSWLPNIVRQAGAPYPTRYRQARHKVGPPAKGPVRFVPGGPRISGVRLPVSGGGDTAHGHTRLEAMVKDIVIPLLEAGHIEAGRVGELQRRLRGGFAGLYRLVERTNSKSRKAKNL